MLQSNLPKEKILSLQKTFDATERQIQLENIKNIDGKIIVPLNFAVQNALLSSCSVYFRNTDSESTVAPVESFKLVGGNGIGKTASVLSEGISFIKKLGFNPIVFDGEICYPTSTNDVLVLYISWVGKESHDIEGLPFRNTIKVPVVKNGETLKDENGEVLFKEEDGLTYSVEPAFKTLSLFNRALVIFDELNRSPELDIANALLNGEKVKGVKMPKNGTIIFAMQNSDSDGINIIRTKQDGASNTKASTFHVYQPVQHWQKWAYKNKVHPALIAFAMQNKDIFEIQKNVEDYGEMAFPTLRGLTKLSEQIIEKEEFLSLIFGDSNIGKLEKNELSAMFQSRVGLHPDKENLPESFAHFYIYMQNNLYESVRRSVFEPYSNPYFGMGINGDEELNNKLYYSTYKNVPSLYSKGFSYNEKDGTMADLFASIKKYSIPSYTISFANEYLNNNTYNIFDNARLRALIDKENLEEAKKQSNFDKSTYELLAEIEQGNLKNIKSFKLDPMLCEFLDNKIEKNLSSSNSSFYLKESLSDLVVKCLRIISPTISLRADFSEFKYNLAKSLNISQSTPGYKYYKMLFNNLFKDSEFNSYDLIQYLENYHYIYSLCDTFKLFDLSDENSKNFNMKNYASVVKMLNKKENSHLKRYFQHKNGEMISEVEYNRFMKLFEFAYQTDVEIEDTFKLKEIEF